MEWGVELVRGNCGASPQGLKANMRDILYVGDKAPTREEKNPRCKTGTWGTQDPGREVDPSLRSG